MYILLYTIKDNYVYKKRGNNNTTYGQNIIVDLHCSQIMKLYHKSYLSYAMNMINCRLRGRYMTLICSNSKQNMKILELNWSNYLKLFTMCFTLCYIFLNKQNQLRECPLRSSKGVNIL